MNPSIPTPAGLGALAHVAKDTNPTLTDHEALQVAIVALAYARNNPSPVGTDLEYAMNIITWLGDGRACGSIDSVSREVTFHVTPKGQLWLDRHRILTTQTAGNA